MEESGSISKKRAKKDAARAEKLSEADLLSPNYGDVPVQELQSKEISGCKWTEVKELPADLADQTVVIRGWAQTIRAVGKKMPFLVVRQFVSTVQCVLTVDGEFVSVQMVKFVNGLSQESIVDIEGVVLIPKEATFVG